MKVMTHLCVILLGSAWGFCGFPSLATASELVGLQQQEIKFVPYGSGSGVTLSFTGKLYDKGKGLVVDSQAKDPIAVFLERLVSSSRSPNKAALLNLWNPDERPAIEKAMGMGDAFERNQQLYSNVLSTRIVGLMIYGEFVICFVDHNLRGVDSLVKIYPLMKKGEAYYLTNRLSDDFLYSSVLDRLAQYLWGPERK